MIRLKPSAATNAFFNLLMAINAEQDAMTPEELAANAGRCSCGEKHGAPNKMPETVCKPIPGALTSGDCTNDARPAILPQTVAVAKPRARHRKLRSPGVLSGHTG